MTCTCTDSWHTMSSVSIHNGCRSKAENGRGIFFEITIDFSRKFLISTFLLFFYPKIPIGCDSTVVWGVRRLKSPVTETTFKLFVSHQVCNQRPLAYWKQELRSTKRSNITQLQGTISNESNNGMCSCNLYAASFPCRSVYCGSIDYNNLIAW